jgi:hypothetical protein
MALAPGDEQPPRPECSRSCRVGVPDEGRARVEELEAARCAFCCDLDPGCVRSPRRHSLPPWRRRGGLRPRRSGAHAAAAVRRAMAAPASWGMPSSSATLGAVAEPTDNTGAVRSRVLAARAAARAAAAAHWAVYGWGTNAAVPGPVLRARFPLPAAIVRPLDSAVGADEISHHYPSVPRPRPRQPADQTPTGNWGAHPPHFDTPETRFWNPIAALMSVDRTGRASVG